MKGGWNCGKSAKGDGEERMRAKREIKAEIREAEADFVHRYKKSRRSRDREVSLRGRIEYYDQQYTAAVVRENDGTWYSSWSKQFYHKMLETARKQLRELIEKKKKDQAK